MWQIGNPSYLWGLLGLIIPILIHLYNKRKTKVKILGSLRWLKEVQPAQWHFRRIHQWPLMFLRILIIVVAVLLLADFHKVRLPGLSATTHDLFLLHPNAGDTTQFRRSAIEWENDSVKVLWLQPYLSPINEKASKTPFDNLWSLIAEADLLYQPDRIHVIAPNRLDYFEGVQPRLNAPVSWELTERNEDTLRLINVNVVNGQHELLWYFSSSEKTTFMLQHGLEASIHGILPLLKDQTGDFIQVNDPSKVYQVPVRYPDTLHISAEIDAEMEKEWLLLHKVLRTLSEFYNLPIAKVNNDEADWHFNFSPDTESLLPGNYILSFTYHPDLSVKWLEPVGHNFVVIRNSLTTGNILEGGLIEEMRPYFLKFKYKDVKLPDPDFRKIEILDIPANKNSYKVMKAGYEPSPEFRKYLGLILLILLITERLWPKGMK
jgi:hypothetical protein